MADVLTVSAIHDLLGRWVADGLIDAEQASRIEAAEAARRLPAGSDQGAAGEPPGPGQRRGLVVEALGYLGGALAIVAGFIAVSQLWPTISTSAELAFAAGGAVVLLGAGAAIRTVDDPPLVRLRSVLWLMSTASLAAFVGVLAAQVWDLRDISSAVTTAAAATAYATALWWRSQAPLQHLAVFASAAVLVGTGIYQAWPGLSAWGPGLGVWGLSALWVIAAHRGYFLPREVGYFVGGIGLLVGAQMTMEIAAGQALALVTVAAILTAGVVLRRVILLVLGAIGVIETVPQTAARYLPENVGAPLAILVTGLILLGVALRLARTRKRSAPSGTPPDNPSSTRRDDLHPIGSR
ncbi:MAG TPA: DUF2157 domain-containing protein [Streptosporangiaceae bacterium]